jgi:hypothetical protein
MFAVSLQRPAYNPKFLLLAMPGFLILVARGLENPSSLLAAFVPSAQPTPLALAAVLSLLMLAGSFAGVWGIYFDPRLQRDDYRSVVATINRYSLSTDAVLVDAPGQLDVFDYYYRGAAKVFALPIGRPMQKQVTDAALDDLVQNHANLFAVFWATEQADPESYVERTLSARRFQAVDEWHGNIRFARYGDSLGLYSAELLKGPARFGDEIELASVVRYGPEETLHAGRVLSLTFTWRALKPPAGNYKLFIHLLDGQSKVVSQRDTEPVDNFRPTGSWQAGAQVVDNEGLLIPPELPQGQYTIEVGLYRAEDGARLTLASGADRVNLGSVSVNP